MGPCDTITTADNPYSSKNEETKRIDFIFHNESLKCVENGLEMEEIPGSKCHYSDHKGVRARFTFKGLLNFSSFRSIMYVYLTDHGILKYIKN